MVKIFDFDDYKCYVIERVHSLPKRGRGEFQKIAHALGMHTTLVSQVFRGEKELTFEQACGLCEYFGMSELETDYFLKLVQLARAGTHKSRQILKRQLEKLKTEADQIANRLPEKKRLSEPERAIFYSHWSYSATRLLTSVPKYRSLDAIAERLQLPKNRVMEILEFLLATGLCAEEEGQVVMGPQNTHVEAGSPLSIRHHTNWRLKAMSRLECQQPSDLIFTAPLSISNQDRSKVRSLLLATIEDVGKIVKNSDPDEIGCLNIDWIGI